MTTPSPDKPTINYHSATPESAIAHAGCFVSALLFLILVALYAALAILLFSGAHIYAAGTLIAGIILITTLAILSRKLGISAALAILLAALCILGLTLTLCSTISIF